MRVETIATVSETGDSPFSVAIEVSGHRLTGDEPEDQGGADLGPSPYDLLTAALAECTTLTVRWYARQKGWPLEKVAVEVRHRKGGEGTTDPRQDRFEKTVHLTGPDLSAEQRVKLVEIAARCPIQRSLEGTPLILTRTG